MPPQQAALGDRQNHAIPDDPLPQKAPIERYALASPTAKPALHRNTQSRTDCVRGSRGAGPPGRGSAAAVGRRRCRENAGATSCRPHEAPEGIFFAHVLRSAMSQFMLRSMCTASVFRRQTHRGRAQTALFPAAKGGIIGFRAKPERGEGSAEWLRRSGLI